MTGDYLATGDRGGRITVLKLDAETKSQVKINKHNLVE